MQTTLDEQWVSTFADEHGDWTLKPEDHAVRDADHKQPATGHVLSEVEQQRNLLRLQLPIEAWRNKKSSQNNKLITLLHQRPKHRSPNTHHRYQWQLKSCHSKQAY
jgi:hypothetical protein